MWPGSVFQGGGSVCALSALASRWRQALFAQIPKPASLEEHRRSVLPETTQAQRTPDVVRLQPRD
jgi:hypothetical protein